MTLVVTDIDVNSYIKLYEETYDRKLISRVLQKI